MKKECECTNECLGYLTKECKRIEEPKQETLTGDITIFKSVFKKEHIYNTNIMDFLQFCKKGKEVGIYYKSTLKDVLTLYTKNFNDESNE
jgi:hypothetical protein